MSCSICLEEKPDQVTLKCGHNFCHECVTCVLSTPEEFGVSACPECNEWVQGQVPPSSVSSPPRTFCTFCIQSSVLAQKYCQRCEASLCGKHLLAHSKNTEHVLCDVNTCLRTHESEEENVKHMNVLKKLTTKRDETERRVRNLKESREKVKSKAEEVTEKANVLFKKLRKQLRQIQKRVLQETSRQEEKVLRQVSDLIHKLEVESEELSKKIHHIKHLRTMSGPSSGPPDEDFHDTKHEGLEEESLSRIIHEEEESLSRVIHEEEESLSRVIHEEEESLSRIIHEEEESLSRIIHEGLYQMIRAVRPPISTPSLTPLHLDRNTAANTILLSEDLQAAAWSPSSRNRPVTPQQFESSQVLSSTVFSSGTYYWQVETWGSCWRVGVCYPSIERRGEQSVIGNNDQSWCVCQICDHKDVFHTAKHNRENAAFPSGLSCPRMGIYVDYEAGRVSFYELGLPIRHLHTFTTTFTQPLHAAIYVCGEEQHGPTWVRIID